MERKVIKMIQEDKIVQNTLQRKMCVVVFGDKKKNLPNRAAGERDELIGAKEMITEVVE